MNKAQICPVCSGRGTVPMNFYGWEWTYGNTTFTMEEGRITCRSCSGRGYVIVVVQPDIVFKVPEETI